MGERGITYHARGQRHDFTKAGVPIAVVGTNRSWSSFAPIGDDVPSVAELAGRLDAGVLVVVVDDDHGVQLEAATPREDLGSMMFELALKRPSFEDESFLAALVRTKLLTRTQRDRVESPSDAFEVPSLLGAPASRPLPAPLTRTQAKQLDARIVEPKTSKKSARTAATRPAKATPSSRSAGTPDPATLALHIHYWEELFQLNHFGLAERYKRHLPATRRKEVETLIGFVVMGAAPGQIERGVTAILGSIWKADDWANVIRDPKLVASEPLDDGQRADWTRRIAR